MAHRRRTTLLFCGLVLLAVGGVASSCSSGTQRSASSATTVSARPSPTLPPLGPRLSRRRIIFDDTFAGEGDLQGFGGIDSIRFDGRGLRRIATGTDEFAVSPDRTQIAYAYEGYDEGGIYIIRANGTHMRLIDQDNGGIQDGQPAWSPDGRRLVFIRTASPGPSGALFASTIYVMNTNGSGRRRLAGSAVDFPGPTWMNDREILLISNWGELAVISARTGRPVRLIRLPNKGTQPGDGPRLSPNGREIAVGECDNADCSFESVDLITLGGKLLRRIRGAHSPAWTPNGDLLYACCQQAGILGNTSRIMFAPANGGPTRTITPKSLSADQPEWIG